MEMHKRDEVRVMIENMLDVALKRELDTPDVSIDGLTCDVDEGKTEVFARFKGTDYKFKVNVIYIGKRR